MLKRFDDIPKIMRRHSIEPTVFVISCAKDGRINGMAAGWNMKCSYEPPLMAVALKNNKYTQELIHETHEFVIAVPSPELQETLEYFGSISGREEDKISTSNIELLPATTIKPPLVAQARTNFECRVESIVTAGDHYIIIGEVLAAHYNADKDQLYFAGRDLAGKRVFESKHTAFAEDQNLNLQ